MKFKTKVKCFSMEANGLCSLQKCAEPAVTKLKTQNAKKPQTHNYKIRESRRHNKTNKRQIKSAFKNVEKGENKSKRYNSQIIF